MRPSTQHAREQAEPEDLTESYYVFPRYLAGSTYTGDPALEPLIALGWELTHDNLANVYLTAPDRTIHLGYLPEGDDDGLWRINAYEDRFGPPAWGACFNDSCPTEFVTAFTTALAHAYQGGPEHYLARPDPNNPEHDASHAIDPLLAHGWTLQQERWGLLAQPGDGMARLEYATGRLEPTKEVTTLQARWFMSGGPKNGHANWYATASTNTPAALVKALTQSICDPAPVQRWKDGIPRALRQHAQLIPVTPPPPSVPTPLDIRRTATRRPPAIITRSVPRWSTTTTPSAALPTRASSPRR